MSLISLLLPTRGRPQWVKRFFLSLIETTTELERIEIILYIDDDDVTSHTLDHPQLSITRIIGPKRSMGQYNHTCLQHAKGQIIMLVNDDIVVRTKGWDEKIIQMDKQFEDKIYLAYTNDLFKKGWCSFPILSRRACDILQEPYPLDYRGAFIDTHLFDVFQRLKQAHINRLCYLEDVVFEHLHYRAGKAVCDETYQKRGRFADDETFIHLASHRNYYAHQLIAVIKNKPSATTLDHIKEEIPRGLFPRIYYLSRIFLIDKNLPWRWRCFLWYWFIGRYFMQNKLRYRTFPTAKQVE